MKALNGPRTASRGTSIARIRHHSGTVLTRFTPRQRVQCKAIASPVDVLSTTYEGAPLSGVEFGVDGVVPYKPFQLTQQIQAPPEARPIIILPGFGNCSADYEAPFGRSEDSLMTNLRERGFYAAVVPIERAEWFNVARALFTIKFWSSNLTTSPGYTWYLEKVHKLVTETMEATGATQVDLVCHSAGGWLGRAYLGDARYQLPPGSPAAVASESPNPHVRAVITLGTPQKPPPAELMRDMTGGALAWVHNTFPGAFFAGQGVSYINVAGMTVKGKREVDANGKTIQVKDRPRMPCEYSHDSYQQVCGEGQGIIGDAVVPLDSAFLSGARHVMLPGVWHSMSQIGTFDTESGVVWYGSAKVIDRWLGPYVREAYEQEEKDEIGSDQKSRFGDPTKFLAWAQGLWQTKVVG